MEFTKQQIINAIDELEKNRAVSQEKIIEAMRKNILEEKITQEDVQFILNRMNLDTVDEEGNITEFVLLDNEFLAEQEKIDAENYLSETDWIIAKISESQLQGEDITALLEKYSAEITKRAECRAIL